MQHLLASNTVDEAISPIARGDLSRARAETRGTQSGDLDHAAAIASVLFNAGRFDEIATLAATANAWQRDGVTAALVYVSTDKIALVEEVVARLLACKPANWRAPDGPVFNGRVAAIKRMGEQLLKGPATPPRSCVRS